MRSELIPKVDKLELRILIGNLRNGYTQVVFIAHQVLDIC